MIYSLYLLCFSNRFFASEKLVPFRSVAIHISIDGLLISKYVYKRSHFRKWKENSTDLISNDVDRPRNRTIICQEVGNEPVIPTVACNYTSRLDNFATPCCGESMTEFDFVAFNHKLLCRHDYYPPIAGCFWVQTLLLQPGE